MGAVSDQPTSLWNLAGKVGLVLGILDEHSIAADCAQHLADAGARLVATYPNPTARASIAAVTPCLPCEMLLPCDESQPGALEAVFDAVQVRFGRLDFVVHAVAVQNHNHRDAEITNCSAVLDTAMRLCQQSFIRAAKLAKPLMKAGGVLLIITFQDPQQGVARDHLMGSVEVALGRSVRRLATELKPQRIRVYAISSGPIDNRAARGMDRSDGILARAAVKLPEKKLISINDVGWLASFLVSDPARAITGVVIPVDRDQYILTKRITNTADPRS